MPACALVDRRSFNLIRGEDLMPADSNGLSDPFVEMTLNEKNSKKLKSKVIKKTLVRGLGAAPCGAFDCCVCVCVFFWSFFFLALDDVEHCAPPLSRSQSPVWNETFYFDVKTPLSSVIVSE